MKQGIEEIILFFWSLTEGPQFRDPVLSDLPLHTCRRQNDPLRSCLLLGMHPPLLGFVRQTLAQVSNLL